MKDSNIIMGLQVDVSSQEMKERLEKAVQIVDRRIEDLALRAEKGSLTAEDFEDSRSPDLEDLSDLPPRRLKVAVRRKLDRLNEAKTQIGFLAAHVVPGVTYRLDAEDARRLAVLHCDVD